MYLFRWLLSRSVRKAGELEDNVRKILNHQRDILAPQAVTAIEEGLKDYRTQVRGGANKQQIETLMRALEDTANKWLKPYPNGSFRENVLMLLEIAVLIVGSRAFFIQPMVIPTGSAQPTLWGVTYEDLRETNTPIPSWPMQIWDKAMKGASYYHVVAPADLEITGWDSKPTTVFPFVKKQNLQTTAGPIPIWFPPEGFPVQLGMFDEAKRVIKKQAFRQGEDIVRVRVVTGDHLFVERVSYNFRRPERGDIIVFRSEKHPGMTADTHYIKRLVAVGGESVRIGDDRHTYINGRQLTTNDPGFDKVFGFDPSQPPRKDHYSGHVNGTVWMKTLGEPGYTPNFPNGTTEVMVRPKHYLTFGDNTMNSADSRYWPEPDFPQERVIGKHCMVFWPFLRDGLNFGWGKH